MKRMNLFFAGLLLLGTMGILVSSCNLMKGGKSYYSTAHYVAFYKDFTGAPTYLNWGDKLEYLGVNYTNTTNNTVFYKCKNPIEGNIGFVDKSSVIESPISKAVILDSIIVYQTPTKNSMTRQNVNPPVLAYIVEIKDNEWAKIEPYNTWEMFDYTNVTKLYNCKWLPIKDISTNKNDVNILIAVQISTKKYREAKKKYENAPSDKTLSALEDVLKNEKKFLESTIADSPQSAAVKYAYQLIEIMFPPSSSGDASTTSPDSNQTSGGNESL